MKNWHRDQMPQKGEEDIECDGRKTESAMGGRQRVRWEEDRECDGRKT